jgi:hypothetical protein
MKRPSKADIALAMERLVNRKVVMFSDAVRERMVRDVTAQRGKMSPNRAALADAFALNIEACSISPDQRFVTIDLHKVKP